MAPSFVRSSKFRHVFGTGAKRPDNAYEYALFIYWNIYFILIKTIKTKEYIVNS